MIKYDSYIAYYNAQTEEAKKHLSTFQKLIEETLPYYHENMKYGVPCFDLIENGEHDDIVMVSCYKNHISFYPRVESLEPFRDRLSKYKVLKGTVQIKYKDTIDIELFKEVLADSLQVVLKK